MGDFLKEFNMIDILGMMLPGSLIVALMAGEYDVWSQLASVLGVAEVTGGAIAFIILVVGYVVGMLLHELCDILQKILWSEAVFHPCYWAAISTGYDKRISTEESVTASKGWVYYIYVGLVVICTIYPFWPWRYTIIPLVWMFVLPVLTAFCIWIFTVRRREDHYVIHFFPVVVLMVILWMICKLYNFKSELILLAFPICAILRLFAMKEGVSKITHEKMFELQKKTNTIRSKTQSIPAFYGFSSEGNDDYDKVALRKRNLFEGFQTSARNLLVCFLLLGVYASFTNGKMNGYLMKLRQSETACAFGAIILFLLMWRYLHYAFLRYKYACENALLAVKKPTETQ